MVFAMRHACLLLGAGKFYFGALSCVAPCFFASSAPVLQVSCNELASAAHLLNAMAASSKWEAFLFSLPSRYKFTGSGAGLGAIFTHCSSSGVASLNLPRRRYTYPRPL